MHPSFQRKLQIVTLVLLVVSFLFTFFIKRSTPDTTDKESGYYALTVGGIVAVVTVFVGTLVSIVSEKKSNNHPSKKTVSKGNTAKEPVGYNYNVIGVNNWI